LDAPVVIVPPGRPGDHREYVSPDGALRLVFDADRRIEFVKTMHGWRLAVAGAGPEHARFAGSIEELSRRDLVDAPEGLAPWSPRSDRVVLVIGPPRFAFVSVADGGVVRTPEPGPGGEAITAQWSPSDALVLASFADRVSLLGPTGQDLRRIDLPTVGRDPGAPRLRGRYTTGWLPRGRHFFVLKHLPVEPGDVPTIAFYDADGELVSTASADPFALAPVDRDRFAALEDEQRSNTRPWVDTPDARAQRAEARCGDTWHDATYEPRTGELKLAVMRPDPPCEDNRTCALRGLQPARQGWHVHWLRIGLRDP
jgi:hypothetical protein